MSVRSLVTKYRSLSWFDAVFYSGFVIYAVFVVSEALSPSVVLTFSSTEYAAEVPAAVGSAIGFGAGFAGGVFGAFIGVLTVTFLTLFGGLPLTLAKGTSVFQAAFTSFFAVSNHYRSGTADIRAGAAVGVGGIVGAVLGAAWSAGLDESTMRGVFSAVLVGGAVYMARESVKSGGGEIETTDRSLGFVPDFLKFTGSYKGVSYTVDLLTSVLLGLGIGFVAGLLGVGGGFLLTPSINVILGLPIHVAVGTSSSVVMANSVSATTEYLSQGAVFLELGVAVLVGGFFGARLGQKVNHRLPDRALKAAFSVLLVWSAWRMMPQIQI
ncbi:sulfite exporter TauE/SafE family protein [Halorutilales archaeon Cl-col2-1]